MGVVRLSKGWSHDEMSVGIAVSRHVSIVANTQAEGGGGCELCVRGVSCV